MFQVHPVCRQIRFLIVVSSLLAAGCSQQDPGIPPQQSASDTLSAGEVLSSADKQSAASSRETDEGNHQSPLHNLLQLSDRIYSGGEPDGDAAFENLSQLGIRTIVSVDGARPDVAAARRHGLRYVHIPVGYDGISELAGQSLTRVVRETAGAIYIHCHHGRHRGPAAAAIACLAAGATDVAGALQILERAGTSRDYAGLWNDVEHFQLPAPDDELPELVESAGVSSLASAMSHIDRFSDLLKQCRQAGWSAPFNHPDLVPAQEALLLKEGLHEAARHLDASSGAEFRQWLFDAETSATLLAGAIKAGRRADADQQADALEESCRRCHTKYRNQPSL